MEEVEEANKAAIESSHRVLNLISKPSQDHAHYSNLKCETGEAVFRFKRVVSLLNTTLGHARVRRIKHCPAAARLPQTLLLDNPLIEKSDPPPINPRFLQSSFLENRAQLGSFAKSSLTLGCPSFENSLDGKNAQQIPPNPYLVLQQQQQQLQHRIQIHQQQQQMKQQAELMFRNHNKGINLNFDSSPTLSSTTRSLVSSLSVDGSSFHLIGGPRSSDQSSQQHKRKCSARGEDGSVKCGSSSRCHCSKKRKHRIKRSIKVPAVSNKLADIPPDDYSWRKYGQKPIKGSPHPRYFPFFDMVANCI
ncbi:hypothetical protein ACFE04_014296 [Oxalis oulophora]